MGGAAAVPATGGVGPGMCVNVGLNITCQCDDGRPGLALCMEGQVLGECMCGTGAPGPIPSCPAGETRNCSCPDGSFGTQQCNAAGTPAGPCSCGGDAGDEDAGL
jgi:hypothetical protein